VYSLECRLQALGLTSQGYRFPGLGCGIRVQGILGFRVQGSGFTALTAFRHIGFTTGSPRRGGWPRRTRGPRRGQHRRRRHACGPPCTCPHWTSHVTASFISTLKPLHTRATPPPATGINSWETFCCLRLEQRRPPLDVATRRRSGGEKRRPGSALVCGVR